MATIPTASHPVWERLITGTATHKFSLFAANMAIDQAKRQYKEKPGDKAAIVKSLVEFFDKYSKLTADELASIS
ncbi:MAG: hypothetical protein P4L98_12215 [Ancalomicrobiaceae bacterium]|nr:hypothetical protein [Ancalomicrobiaceae bacterium]